MVDLLCGMGSGAGAGVGVGGVEHSGIPCRLMILSPSSFGLFTSGGCTMLPTDIRVAFSSVISSSVGRSVPRLNDASMAILVSSLLTGVVVVSLLTFLTGQGVVKGLVWKCCAAIRELLGVLSKFTVRLFLGGEPSSSLPDMNLL